MLPGTQARSYPGIDLLRGFAALLVLAYHVVEHGRWTAMPNSGYGYVVRHGWVGVDLFLVTSGFVITLSALECLRRDPVGARLAFATRRLARIVPLYLLTGAVFLVLVRPAMLGIDPGKLAVHVLSHLFFVHNLHPSTHGSINGPSWSVALEMQFYLAMLLAMPWLARRSVAGVLVALVGIALAWRYAVTLVLPMGESDTMTQFVALTQLPGVLDEFGVGIALAMVVHRGTAPLATWLVPGWRNFTAWLALAAALLSAAALTDQAFEQWSNRWMLVAWRTLLATGFAALLATAMTCPAASSRLLAPARYLGDISYGIYLWHMLVLITLLERHPNLGGRNLLFVTLAGTLLLSVVTWHLLEKPHLEKYKVAASPRTSS